ncbi:MAG: hypothetical protein Q4D21_03320 [Phascolarctobacterium sp.]|nr:hypothetical protein [Phascolarctobacterium sp.]
MKCEKCNEEMIYFQQEQTCGYSCPNCGNGICTTYYSPVYMDDTIYSVFINASANPNIETIKIIAKICNCNFIKAKGILNSGGKITEGEAVLILKIVKQLKEGNIEFKISPEFVYDLL